MFLLLQKDIGFLFVFVKQALFPCVSFRCACWFCKQMRLVYRQAVRSDVVTVTATQEYPYTDTIAGLERMGNCILDCIGHEFVRDVVGSSMSTTRAFCGSLRMLITLPCYVRILLSFPLRRLFSLSWRRITVIRVQEIVQSLHLYGPEPIISLCNRFIITSKWFASHFQQQNYSYIEGPLVMYLHRVT